VPPHPPSSPLFSLGLARLYPSPSPPQPETHPLCYLLACIAVGSSSRTCPSRLHRLPWDTSYRNPVGTASHSFSLVIFSTFNAVDCVARHFPEDSPEMCFGGTSLPSCFMSCCFSTTARNMRSVFPFSTQSRVFFYPPYAP